MIQVRIQRKINQSQRSVAAGGRIDAIVLLSKGRGDHHTPGAHPHIDRLARKLQQEVCQSRLPHPVAQVKGVAATPRISRQAAAAPLGLAYDAVGMQRALDSAIGLPRDSTRAL